MIIENSENDFTVQLVTGNQSTPYTLKFGKCFEKAWLKPLSKMGQICNDILMKWL